MARKVCAIDLHALAPVRSGAAAAFAIGQVDNPPTAVTCANGRMLCCGEWESEVVRPKELL